jgi:hypothetical protein
MKYFAYFSDDVSDIEKSEHPELKIDQCKFFKAYNHENFHFRLNQIFYKRNDFAIVVYFYKESKMMKYHIGGFQCCSKIRIKSIFFFLICSVLNFLNDLIHCIKLKDPYVLCDYLFQYTHNFKHNFLTDCDSDDLLKENLESYIDQMVEEIVYLKGK